MSRASSSTSSSDAGTGEVPPSGALRDLIAVAAWTAVALVVIDAAVGFSLERAWFPAKVRSFFAYGQSIRWKMRALIGRSEATTQPFTQFGWLEPSPLPDPTGTAPDGDMDLTFYGMSFTSNLARAAVRDDPSVKVRSLGGANAPPNHSFAVFRADPRRARSRAAVLGVLAGNVPGVYSRGFTWAFDAPPPYTYPTFKVQGDHLVEEAPPVLSIDGFRKVLYDDAEWPRFAERMGRSDPYFDPFLYNDHFADVSVSFRLVRKAWGQYRGQRVRERVFTANGFDPDSDAIRDLRGTLRRFAAEARAEGVIPVVVLLDTAARSGHLGAALGEDLRAGRVPYVNTASIFVSNDMNNYGPDGHYAPDVDVKIVRAIRELVAREGAAGGDRVNGSGSR